MAARAASLAASVSATGVGSYDNAITGDPVVRDTDGKILGCLAFAVERPRKDDDFEPYIIDMKGNRV